MTSFYDSPLELGLIILGAILIGFSKGGLPGTGVITVWIYATVFGGKQSVGILLPVLICADIYAVVTYRKYVNLKIVKSLVPALIVGALMGAVLFNWIPADQFKKVIGGLLMLMVVFHFVPNAGDKKQGDKTVADRPMIGWFASSSSGLCSMLANAGSPIMAYYLMARSLPKLVFLGTYAWLIFISNMTSLPLHFVIQSVTLKTLPFSFILGSITFVGVWAARRIVDFIPQKQFEYFIWAVITLAGIELLV
jgi:uncharacterized membrane protein YfcA